MLRPARTTGTDTAAHGLVERLAGASGGAFALLYRPRTGGPRHVDVLVGPASHLARLADLALPDVPPPGPAAGGRMRVGAAPGSRAPDGAGHDALVLIPYRQLRERGFACHDDGAPLVSIAVAEHHRPRLRDVLAALPADPVPLRGGGFDIDDARYADLVRAVREREIGRGEGSNFVIHRTFVADVDGWSRRSALALFGRLLRRETGAHWTYLVHTGERTLVGATPERHVGIAGGLATMSPISGTLPYPPGGPRLRGVLDFLADRKETDELAMVLDEELKMMARICPAGGGRVGGPYLRQMARLAHTEYRISGRTDRDVRDILRESLFAPPVVGSPLQNACRVITRYEPAGRGYYSGVAALIGRDAQGGRSLDSAILIRGAQVDAQGGVRIAVGATIVRHSRPEAEAAETAGKAAALLSAFDGGPGGGPGPPRRRGWLSAHPSVRRKLARRNATLSRFWLAPLPPPVVGALPGPAAGARVTVVDGEDMFTAMLAHELRSLGALVTVCPFDSELPPADLTVFGPGPGDPSDTGDPKMIALRKLVRDRHAAGEPLLGLCLGHQIIAAEMGLALRARDVPNQGLQKRIDLFGDERPVGFYNTFTACTDTDAHGVDGWGRVEFARDHATGEVYAMRGERVSGFQFHPESILTRDGPEILATEIARLLAAPAAPR